MAPSKELLADKFINAISYLEDITTIHTDPNLARIKANLLRGNSDDAASDDVVRALEVAGIAKAVATRFHDTPQHHDHARQAIFNASILPVQTRNWFNHHNASTTVSAGTPTSGEGDDGYRAFLLTRLDWVHKYGTVSDGDASTCLCPVTAYLQLILRHTPMKDWAVATAEPDTSPLAFAWALARNTPGIGRQTADAVVLVAMGRHAHRLMVDESVRAKRSAATKNRTNVFTEGVLGALGGAVKDYLIGVSTRSPSVLENYKRVPEPGDAEELGIIMQNAAEKLGEKGERYAQLLGEKEKDVAQEREDVVGSIRALAGFNLGKAEPPVPEKVLLAINDLATGK